MGAPEVGSGALDIGVDEGVIRDEAVALLKAAGRQKLAGGQPELDLGLEPESGRGGPLPMRLTTGRSGGA